MRITRDGFEIDVDFLEVVYFKMKDGERKYYRREDWERAFDEVCFALVEEVNKCESVLVTIFLINQEEPIVYRMDGTTLEHYHPNLKQTTAEYIYNKFCSDYVGMFDDESYAQLMRKCADSLRAELGLNDEEEKTQSND